MTTSSMQMRAMLLAAWVALAGAAFVDPPAGAPGKPLRYVMVLKARAAGIEEPDVAAVGGRELSRWRTRRAAIARHS